jgi:site-specific DNA-methyltransferase (adenine-specific)
MMVKRLADNVTLHLGDCLAVLKTLPDNSVDAVVTDPPYGLAFMGKKWDYDVPSVEIWAECLRVLKPGGHLLAFAGTRTQHRMAVRIEDAGFEIRDMIAWVYGSGFPKSLDVSKAIDAKAGAVREVTGIRISDGGKTGSKSFSGGSLVNSGKEIPITAPATDAASQWQGWGTALKPALEPITLARKPLDGTVAENVLTWGTGGVNVDACRVGTDDATTRNNSSSSSYMTGNIGGVQPKQAIYMTGSTQGRFPANLIHDGSEEVTGLFPIEKNPHSHFSGRNIGFGQGREQGKTTLKQYNPYDGKGPASAARFFYCAKSSKADRGDDNGHPTVKPTDLMRYLCRLVTPPGGIVLDPFMGSGSTGKGAVLEGFGFIGIEREQEYLAIAVERIAHAGSFARVEEDAANWPDGLEMYTPPPSVKAKPVQGRLF